MKAYEIIMEHYELVIRHYEVVKGHYELVIKAYEVIMEHYEVPVRLYGVVVVLTEEFIKHYYEFLSKPTLCYTTRSTGFASLTHGVRFAYNQGNPNETLHRQGLIFIDQLTTKGNTTVLSIVYGILSAATWGAADFIGGFASKRTSPYRVLFLAEIAGMVPFTALALLLREPLPPASDMFIGAGSSLIGLAGLLFLYSALASGQMSIAAPVSALFAAVLPVVFGFLTLGAPSMPTLLGFALAFGAVWFISQTGMTNWRFSLWELRFALLSGFFFGLYFLTLHRATLNAFFWPLAAARFAGFVVLGIYALVTRQPALPPRDLWGFSVVNGVLDIGGNAFYILAAQTGRLDVAAVLSSLYPASTVLLAWLLLKERLTWLQTGGVLLAFVAIVLFTL